MLVEANTKNYTEHKVAVSTHVSTKKHFCYFSRELLCRDLRFLEKILLSWWIQCKKKKNNLILKFKVRVNFVTGSLHVFSSKSKVCGIHLWQLWTNFSFHPVPAGWQKCACSLSSRFSLIIALVLMALADYVAYARRGSFHRFDTICSISSSFLLWTRRATKRLREPRHPFCLAISAVSIIQRETFTVVPSIMKIQNDTGNFLAGFLAVLSVYFSRLRNIRFLTIFGKIYVHISLSGEIFSNSSVLRLTSLFIDVLFCL